ncbi:MAG: sulfite exporter TauE/SafE family protein, partial [Clostridia bacterium]|nr:sulfite exporter TauE/SafE family protein [Clostridia bacterium]
DAVPYIIPSVIGAIVGTFLLYKIPTEWLKKIFALFMLYAGVRLFLR